ncbi:hypothetical protein GCM10017771_18170 [Streptomyces capitiformicae]|uniref:Transposase IS110-like N-terminal domain-containing protein n=1 Tax=Streptomyces capitiformicae TaxID=2014920 RepID=A0A919GJ52_9ACTN|nr:hypothetical protein GCM10017771_18170 [Streptomyces capitiformicae]
MFDTEDVGVFLGLDVGETTHHGHGLTPAGKKFLDKQLPNSEPKLRAVFDKLTAKFGIVLVIVDQPASIGALPLTVAQATGPCPPGEEPQWQARVRVLAVDLFVPGDVVARDLERLAAATKFPAALLGVTIEDTSTRGILRPRNVSGDLEVIRTDRGDADAGAAKIARARALVGRRVLVHKDMEGLASNPMHKVRGAVRLMDLGPELEAIGEDEAKNHVLAADGDKDAALHVWNGAGLPERGPVSAEQLGRALAAVPVT